jgi:hypothetical protein
MRSIRRLGLVAVLFAMSCTSGCAYDAGVFWPPGTAATLADRSAPRVLAEVPPEQRAIVKRRSLAIPNGTPVTVVDDPAYRPLTRNAIRSALPEDLVRVRVTTVVDQPIELLVRRQDVAVSPGPKESSSAWLPISLLILIATAVTVWLVDTLMRTWKRRHDVNRDEITIDTSARVGPHKLIPRPTTRVADRGDAECDQWVAWIAGMTVRRKLRCLGSCRRFPTTSH